MGEEAKTNEILPLYDATSRGAFGAYKVRNAGKIMYILASTCIYFIMLIWDYHTSF